MRKYITPVLLLLIGLLIFLNPEIKEIPAGVAILLFGMIMLEDGFHTFVSGPLQRLLNRSTDKLHKSLLLGFASTAVLQSSSLISVITISFISAGLIGLKAGIGIIFGSNLGTTVTAWMVSLLGLKIDIAGLSMPMLAFGIILVLQRSKKLKGLGQIMAGLGFFFMGIYFMKNGFEVFKENIDLAAYAMSGIWGVFVFTFIGIVITIVLQSSSAAMALILSALLVGQISYFNSLALAIGANIGTTITAIIGSFSSSVAGKRLAGAHLIFNLVTGLFALLFLNQLADLVEWVSDICKLSSDNYILRLSIFHTVFNVIGILLMVPFVERLIRFLERRIKEADDEMSIDQAHYLDPSLLSFPQTALKALIDETKRLFEKVAFKIIAHGMNIHRDDIYGDEKIKNIVKRSRSEFDLDIQEMYSRKVKTVYSEIIEYATLAQSELTVSEELIKYFANIKIANRKIVESIKAMEEVHQNFNKYLQSENSSIQKEYDKLRKKLGRILRELYLLKESKDPEKHLQELAALKSKAKTRDILVDGSIDDLLRAKKITREMASSLVNDSQQVSLISQRLIESAQLIYISIDDLFDTQSITKLVEE